MNPNRRQPATHSPRVSSSWRDDDHARAAGHELMEHSESFRALIGGAEANVAGAAGVHAGWIGKLLPHRAGSLGRQRHAATASIRRRWSAVKRGASAPSCRVRRPAASDEDDLRPGGQRRYRGHDRRRARLGLHRRRRVAAPTGITPALSATWPRERHARDHPARLRAGVKTSFDLNFRAGLWSPDGHRAAAWHEILPDVSIITTEADAALLLAACRDGPVGRLPAGRLPPRGGGGPHLRGLSARRRGDDLRGWGASPTTATRQPPIRRSNWSRSTGWAPATPSRRAYLRVIHEPTRRRAWASLQCDVGAQVHRAAEPAADRPRGCRAPAGRAEQPPRALARDTGSPPHHPQPRS